MDKLEIKDISKSYGADLALQQISFTAQKGKVLGLLGPNGAGKTSLIRIINRIILEDSGKVLIDGKEIKDSITENIGYLPEERGLYRNEKVLTQLVYFARLKGLSKAEAQKNAEEWLKKFNVSDWANKKVQSLSKGMAQKIQFIAAVIHDPEIIILDEPFSGFDPVNVELIKKELVQFKEDGKIILISTHNMNSAEELCDEIVLINKGKLVLSGEIQKIRTDFSEDLHSITFEGNMIAFANALWTGYELIKKESFSESRHIAYLKMKQDNDLTALVKTMEGQVKVESVQKYFPSMHEIFIKVINPTKTEA